MAEGTYWSGVGGVVKFTPDLTSIEITLNNFTWTKNAKNRLAEVTNAQSGGHAKYIASVSEADGSFDVVWDSAAVPENLGIFPGSSGTIKEYLGGSTKFKSQSIVIEQISHKVDTRNGAITYTCTYKGNGAITNN